MPILHSDIEARSWLR